MLDVRHGLDLLELGILEQDPRGKGGVDGDVYVLVDRSGHEKAAVFPIVGGQVGASAAEGDPKGGSGDDHRG